MRMLGKQDPGYRFSEWNQYAQIGRDLEERNKEMTLKKLKEQGRSYKEFNDQILKLLEKDKKIIDEEDDQAVVFKKQIKNILSCEYYDEKYNIDYQVNKKFSQEVRDMKREKVEQIREELYQKNKMSGLKKRDAKLNCKDLLKKYI